MNAWSGDPVPEHLLRGTTALQRQGALVFQVKQCHNCHALGAGGGERGPRLDRVAVRLTQDQLIRQVIQGGGNNKALMATVLRAFGQDGAQLGTGIINGVLA